MINHLIRMISEGSCDTEVIMNKFSFDHRNKLYFIKYIKTEKHY